MRRLSDLPLLYEAHIHYRLDLERFSCVKSDPAHEIEMQTGQQNTDAAIKWGSLK